MTGTAGRVLGLDYGSRRVGVALSDPLRILAGPLTALENDASLLDELSAVVREQEVTCIVVGMPYAADGGKGRKALEVEAFIRRLSGRVSVPVETWDESYTTVEAHRAHRDGGMKKKQRRQKERVDVMAARLLLQEYLEHIGRPGSHPGIND